MIGTPAERNLLGALILKPGSYFDIEGEITADHFNDARLGGLYDLIVQMIVRGEVVEEISVMNAIQESGLGLESSIVFEVATAEVMPHIIIEYAKAVRTAAARRGTISAIAVANSMLSDGADPAAVATRVAEQLREVSQTGGMLMQSRPLGDILAEEDVYEWVIDGLLEKHDRLIVTGHEGSGKTTLMRQLCVLSAAGIHPLDFTAMEPKTVLVIDAENTERQWRRATSWTAQRAGLAGSRDPRAHVHIVAGKRIDITSGPHLGEIHRLIDRHQPDIVFMGPLYKMVPRAIMNDDDAAPLITALDSIRERDLALIMEAHAGHAQKVGGGRDLRPRGSSALLGWPEFGFGLQPTDDDPDLFAVSRWRGDRESRSWPNYLRRGSTNEWPWEAA